MYYSHQNIFCSQIKIGHIFLNGMAETNMGHTLYERNEVRIEILNNTSPRFPTSIEGIIETLERIPVQTLRPITGIEVLPFLYPQRPTSTIPYGRCVPEIWPPKNKSTSRILLFDHVDPLQRVFGKITPIPLPDGPDTSLVICGRTFSMAEYDRFIRDYVLPHEICHAAVIFKNGDTSETAADNFIKTILPGYSPV